MSDLSQLLEFGFDEPRAKRALRKTGNRGLQPALDYLQEHEGSDGADSDGEDGQDMNIASAGGSDAEAKSLKCTDCGKVFRSTAEASYHGDKSGHSNFEESTEEKKALTEEEKKEKLKELQEKAAIRKAAAAKANAEEAKRNEEIRRKGGQDMGKIKEDLKLKEAEKEAKQRKQDKLDEAKARVKVKAKIEQDKRERAEKFAREKAIRDGTAPATSLTSVGNVSNEATTEQKPAAGSSSKSDSPQTRLQIRLPYGQPIITTRESTEKLKDTVAWVRDNCNQQIFQGTVSLPFPRRVLTDAEMEKTLKELDLTPSSVIIIN